MWPAKFAAGFRYSKGIVEAVGLLGLGAQTSAFTWIVLQNSD